MPGKEECNRKYQKNWRTLISLYEFAENKHIMRLLINKIQVV